MNYTALHHVAASGDTQGIKLLIDKGATANLISRYGDTALDITMIWGLCEGADYLQSRGFVKLPSNSVH
jgi:ankyrin repeat protein